MIFLSASSSSLELPVKTMTNLGSNAFIFQHLSMDSVAHFSPEIYHLIKKKKKNKIGLQNDLNWKGP